MALAELVVGDTNRSVNADRIRVAASWADLGRRLPAHGPLYLPDERFFIAAIPASHLDAAAIAFPLDVRPGVSHGYVAMSDVCPRDQCQVPFCNSSQWFECPCCGSKFTKHGEKRGGPTPRGLDLYPVMETSKGVVVDKTRLVLGLSPDGQFSSQTQEGPHCA